MTTTAPATATAAPATATTPATSSSAPASSASGPGNDLRGGPHDVHDLILDDSAEVFSHGATDEVTIEVAPPGVAIPPPRRAGATAGQPVRATYTSRVVETPFAFNDLVPSWNVDLPEGAGFVAEIRVGRKKGDFWTPWLYFGTWGTGATTETKTVHDDVGVVEIDVFRSPQTFDRVQYRFVLATTAADRSPIVRRVALSCSNTLGNTLARAELSAPNDKPTDPGPPSGWMRRLPVPWRSQGVEDEAIRSQICSPTCVAMVLHFYGIDAPTAKVAALTYDPHYRIYGNWIRAVQAAHMLGSPGYLQRFGDWAAVKQHIAAGRPVIASIRAEPGELRNAPYNATDGHLIVIAGFDANDNVHVNDPAARTIEAGVVTYFQEDLQKAWLDHSGVGYVLTGPAK